MKTMFPLYNLDSSSSQYSSFNQLLDSAILSGYHGLSQQQEKDLVSKGYHVYRGKVRDCLVKDNSIYLVHTDRLSAYDRPIALVPFKGIFLAAINSYWLNKISRDFPVAKFSYQEPRVIQMQKLNVFPVEVVVRGFLAGSMQRAYEKGERIFCGESLPNGLSSWQKLPESIVTPTSKASVGSHDEETTPEDILRKGLCTEQQWNKISEIALNLFKFGQAVYNKLGWILVDTKYEFGFDSSGEPYLVDEVHTPDSSRLWVKDSYKERVNLGKSPQMLDKEIIRSYLREQGFMGEGEVPVVPQEKIIDLAKVYLSVTETLYERELSFHPSLDQKEHLLKSLQ